MELDFDDALSEEWISQPRSSAAPSVNGDSSVLINNDSHHSASLSSRLPRPKSRSSLSKVQEPSVAGAGAGVPSETPLHDKRASDLNVRKTRQSTEGVNSLGKAFPARLGSRYASSRSLSSNLAGTVQHKNVKGSAALDSARSTPEWKRRVLQGTANAGGQQNLFSPIGLENMFKPPSPRAQPSSPQWKAKFIACADDSLNPQVMPSSPPPYPAFMQKSKIDVGKVVNGRDRDRNHPPSAAAENKHIRIRNASVAKRSGSLKNADRQEQQEACHETISPIQVNDACIDLKSVEQSVRKLKQKMDLLGIEEQARPSSRSSDNGLYLRGQNRMIDDFNDLEDDDADLADCTSTSLPHDTSLASKTLASNGAFVTTRRGARFSDSSFMMRPLSPSSFPMHSLPAAPTPPVRSVTPEATKSELLEPETPEHSPMVSASSPTRAKSSGSPLKLFDKYDTFTNDRLCRRLSQFESRSIQSETEHGPNEEFLPSSPSPRKAKHQPRTYEKEPSSNARRISNFGIGELDGFGFDHEESNNLNISFNPDDAQADISPLVDPSSATYTELRDEASSRTDHEQRRTEAKSVRRPTVLSVMVSQAREKSDESYPRLQDGKRALNSPTKIPVPKRQRLSEKSPDYPIDISAKDDYAMSSSHAVAGKKRKDARYEVSDTKADPEILASRRILHPRVSFTYPQGAPPAVDTPTEILAGELASFANGITEEVVQGNRKKSVTTADFFMEANLIMQNIRAQARPHSGRASAQESDHEQLPSVLESFQEDFTLEEFSRPASREGNHTRQPRLLRPLDARVVSHLRKFEENDDLGLVLSSSLRPLTNAVEDDSQLSQGLESDPPNIRIRENRDHDQNQVYDNSEPFPAFVDEYVETRSSDPLSSNPSGRSIPTASSGGSAPRAVIALEKVSHLLSENMGGMTFDPKKQCWIKRSSSRSKKCSEKEHVGSDLTEDDPFQEIPDLTVDESQEMRNVHASATNSRPSTMESQGSVQTEQSQNLPSHKALPIRGKAPSHQDAESSAMSKFSRLASSGPTVETRATSWGEPPLQMKKNGAKTTLRTTTNGVIDEQDTDIKGSATQSPRKYQARAVTVAFSSPLVETIGDPRNELSWDESLCDLNDEYDAALPESEGTANGTMSSNRLASQRSNPRQQSRRQVSMGHRTFETRPVSRIDEQDEHSFQDAGASHEMDMTLALSTPRVPQDALGPLSMPSTANKNSSIGFHLTPLPDFTINQSDESFDLDVRYVARRRGLLSIQDVEDNFSLATKDLVKQITNVEPYEPYWEYIRKLNLQDSGLLTLHMLDEFCNRIEELDVSGNDLGQLHGAPQTLRDLRARDNCLSSMTAWGHLQNLQYLDVSSNKIKSLKGLQCLFHLREINAENNEIDTLDGVAAMDSLLKLNVSDNLLERLDFDGAELQRLVTLEVHSNKVCSVRGLQHLSALETLDLSNNKLKSFAFDERHFPRSMRSIDLSSNGIAEVDVSRAPKLRLLNLDSNHVQEVKGVQLQEPIEFLSLRNQELESTTDVTEHVLYERHFHANFLCLSGNRLPDLSPTSFFFNLRRLELASCGLEALAEDFGLKLPNLQALNLNYNALKDIRPLLGITSLNELHIAGNRISRLRRTMTVLGKVGQALEILDCRDNPITLGFYSPHKTTIITTQAAAAAAAAVAAGAEQQSLVRRDQSSHSTLTSRIGSSEHSELNGQTYLAPMGNEALDAQHWRSLDEDTLCRRDVYEVMVLQACESGSGGGGGGGGGGGKQLVQWDGMATARRKAANRQETFARLVELGVLKAKKKEG